MSIKYKLNNLLVIDENDAQELGISNDASTILINDQHINIYWPKTTSLNTVLSNHALKDLIHENNKSNPNAKKYYKINSNKDVNFRRIIDSDILKINKSLTNVKLNNLKLHDSSYKSNFILKSDKSISNLKERKISKKFDNFFENEDDTEKCVPIDFDMNIIRKLSYDYKILGSKFLKMYEVTPNDQLNNLFQEVDSKLISWDNEHMIHKFW